MGYYMKKLLLAASASLTLAACALPGAGGQALEHWKDYGNPNYATSSLAEDQALAVFYRQDNINGPAVNVYANGDYQASLRPNTVSPVALCAARQRFNATFVTAERFSDRTAGTSYTLPVGEVAYIKVAQQPDGSLSFTPVAPDVAKQEIKDLPQATQTLSRVRPQKCEEPVLANISLSANALFGFNQSNYNSIQPEGRREIAAFAQKAKEYGPEAVSSIRVSGYTDPLGSDSYNLKLSQQRADTVKAALLQSGVTSPVQATGYGKQDLLVNNCSALHNNKHSVIECNAPNRRVEITILGNKKAH